MDCVVDSMFVSTCQTAFIVSMKKSLSARLRWGKYPPSEMGTNFPAPLPILCPGIFYISGPYLIRSVHVLGDM